MLMVISPAKSLDYDGPDYEHSTVPEVLNQSETLVKQLSDYDAPQLSELMNISDKLAQLNQQRFQDFQTPFTPDNAKQALLVFDGDVYKGIDVKNYDEDDLTFAQDHLRILSGLYGILRPLDLMQPYRLEMGTKIAHAKLQDLSANTLYEFWADKLAQAINEQLDKHEQKIIINLASNEYFKAVKPKLLQGKIITPVFKDWKNDKYKIISIYAKKARGMMTSFIIRNRIKDIKELHNFAEAGYKYNQELSTKNNPIFTRWLFSFNFISNII